MTYLRGWENHELRKEAIKKYKQGEELIKNGENAKGEQIIKEAQQMLRRCPKL